MATKPAHPTVEELTAFVTGQLPDSQAGEVERHIDQCEPCSETLVSLSTDDTFVELLKQAGEVSEQLTGAMPTTATGSADDMAATLAEHPRYEIVNLIARGGMGVVFKAKHRMMNRTVALKVIKHELMLNAEVVKRFQREVKTAAQLSHPNIVTAYDAEQASGVHFLVMEHVEGITLSDLVKRDGTLEIGQACDYVRQVSAGLQHAHEQGMIHRDIKPHNLMLTEDGTVKILDFGLAALSSGKITEGQDVCLPDASLTSAGSIMGTPDFISPEQAVDAHKADIRSDIYGLGATLYYLISGQPPFSTGGVAERLKDHKETKPVPVNQIRDDVPQDVVDLIGKMLAKDPADRHQNPQELEAELRTLSVAQPNLAVQTSQAPERRLPGKLLAIVAATIAALLAGLIYIETDRGTLAIKTMDENVKVTINKVTGAGADQNTDLVVVDTVTGSSVTQLRSGKYKVSLEGDSNQYQLNQDGFTLSRGGKVVVTVTRSEPEKQEAPPLAEIPVPRDALYKLSSVGTKLSKEEAAKLQIKVDGDPKEFVARLKLLGYYSRRSLMNADARKPHVELLSWFVRNYPEFESLTSGIHPHADPEGYLEIKQLLLENIERYPKNTKVLRSAANFVLLSELDLAETLFSKAQALEPDNPEWAERLGQTLKFKSRREKSV